LNTATVLTGGKHGTKIIGGILTAAGVISGLNPSLLPPSWLPWWAAIGGVAALVRGIVNTQNISTENAPLPPPVTR
jgi:hypothetical protein